MINYVVQAFFIDGIWNIRWIEHFQMSKDTFMDICNQTRPLISKHDTRYRKATIVKIHVLCAIYKLA
jgi:hypothetical protein